MEELREKIVRTLEGLGSHMTVDQMRAGKTMGEVQADAILAIPEIKCALGLLERRQPELDDPVYSYDKKRGAWRT